MGIKGSNPLLQGLEVYSPPHEGAQASYPQLACCASSFPGKATSCMTKVRGLAEAVAGTLSGLCLSGLGLNSEVRRRSVSQAPVR